MLRELPELFRRYIYSCHIDEEDGSLWLYSCDEGPMTFHELYHIKDGKATRMGIMNKDGWQKANPKHKQPADQQTVNQVRLNDKGLLGGQKILMPFINELKEGQK